MALVLLKYLHTVGISIWASAQSNVKKQCEMHCEANGETDASFKILLLHGSCKELISEILVQILSMNLILFAVIASVLLFFGRFGSFEDVVNFITRASSDSSAIGNIEPQVDDKSRIFF